VEMEGVWFRYPEADQVSLASLEPVALPAPERPGDAWVLRDVTFQVPAGKLTALVGPSGAVPLRVLCCLTRGNRQPCHPAGGWLLPAWLGRKLAGEAARAWHCACPSSGAAGAALAA